MHHRLQFGMRENPASDRRHGSRPAVLNGNCTEEQSVTSSPLTTVPNPGYIDADCRLHAALRRAATGETESDHLLTIQQVAAMLHVPVSWVYGRTRKRSTQRLPGIRLGKYWRFREEEIHRWIESQRGGDCAP